MKKIEKNVVNKFLEVSNKGWIESMTTGFIAVGTTFEKELGKKSDSLFLPDYQGDEIKCQQRFSNYPLNLFSKSLDGPYLFSTNEFLQKYGETNTKYNKKELFLDLKVNKFTFKKGYYFNLSISNKEERIYIETYNSKYQLIEKEYYVDFKSIEEIINIKLSSIAHIRASKKNINNINYFRYYYIEILNLKSFKTFIELLEKGLINCEFIGRVSKTSYTERKNKNKGLHFTINQNNIPLLFNKIYSYNSDTKQERTNQFD